MLVYDGMNVDELFGPIDNIEYAPIAHGVFVQSRQVGRKAFVAEIIDVGGDPLGFFEQTLRHGSANAGQVSSNTSLKRQTIPGH